MGNSQTVLHEPQIRAPAIIVESNTVSRIRRPPPETKSGGDEIEAEWNIVTPIEEAWAQLPPPHFPNYAAGSEGPQAANELIREELHGWRTIAPTAPRRITEPKKHSS